MKTTKHNIKKIVLGAGVNLALFFSTMISVYAEGNAPTINDQAIIKVFNDYFWQIYGIFSAIIGGVALVAIAKIAPKYQLGDPDEGKPKEFFKQALMIGGIAFVVLLLPTLLRAFGIL